VPGAVQPSIEIKVEETTRPIAPKVLAPVRPAVRLPWRSIVVCELHDLPAAVAVAKVFGAEWRESPSSHEWDRRAWQASRTKSNRLNQQALGVYSGRDRVESHRCKRGADWRIFGSMGRCAPQCQGRGDGKYDRVPTASHAPNTSSPMAQVLASGAKAAAGMHDPSDTVPSQRDFFLLMFTARDAFSKPLA
jgi:hypothetical protein